MERITPLLVQGMAEGKRREGWEGAWEGGREGEKFGSDSCILFSVPLPSIESPF